MSSNDLENSVYILNQGFQLWTKLQKFGIVSMETSSNTVLVNRRYTFRLLHEGSKEQNSSEIGSGKYSKVFKKGDYAYKIVKIAQTRTPLDISTLRCNLKELVYYNSLNHPNLLSCHKSQLVMQHGQMYRIIHQLQLGKYTLESFMSTKEMFSFECLTYTLYQVLKGIKGLHSRGIIHGDIKPSNIIITKDYNAKITDFTLTTNESKGGSEMSFGSLYWRSPECLSEVFYSKASDIWSFGVILMDCLYGCIYFRDILHIESNDDFLRKLVAMIGPIPEKWARDYLAEPLIDPTEEKEEWIQNISDAEMILELSKEQKNNIQDIITHIFQWDAKKRYTVDELLNHKIFKDVHKSPYISVNTGFPRAKQAWAINWYSSSERVELKNIVRKIYFTEFNEVLGETDEWLLNDCVMLSKHIIDTLKKIPHVTFHLDYVVQISCQLLFFLWKNYWKDDDPLFECELFQVLYLANFNILPHAVSEINVFETPLAAVPKVRPPLFDLNLFQ